MQRFYSNTTLVKVKLHKTALMLNSAVDSNTTLVKVKFETGVGICHVFVFKYNTC